MPGIRTGRKRAQLILQYRQVANKQKWLFRATGRYWKLLMAAWRTLISPRPSEHRARIKEYCGGGRAGEGRENKAGRRWKFNPSPGRNREDEAPERSALRFPQYVSSLNITSPLLLLSSSSLPGLLCRASRRPRSNKATGAGCAYKETYAERRPAEKRAMNPTSHARLLPLIPLSWYRDLDVGYSAPPGG